MILGIDAAQFMLDETDIHISTILSIESLLQNFGRAPE